MVAGLRNQIEQQNKRASRVSTEALSLGNPVYARPMHVLGSSPVNVYRMRRSFALPLAVRLRGIAPSAAVQDHPWKIK